MGKQIRFEAPVKKEKLPFEKPKSAIPQKEFT